MLLRSGDFAGRETSGGAADQSAARRRARAVSLRRHAVGLRAVRGSGARVRRGAQGVGLRRPRPSRPGPRADRAQPSRRRDGRSAGSAPARAARSRVPSHRRRDLRAAAPLRRGRRRVRQLRQPAAQPRSQREGAVDARRDPLPRFLQGADAGRDRRGRPGRRRRLDRADPDRSRQGDGQRAGQRRRAVGLRARHRRRADGGLARGRPQARRRPDHLHADGRRGRRRDARAAGGADRLARGRLAQGQERAVPDQEPAARRPARARAGELLAAGARPVDARRLRAPPAGDERQAARRPPTRPSCRSRSTAWRPSAAWSTAGPRPSWSTPAGK